MKSVERNSANEYLFMLEYGQGKSFAMQTPAQSVSRTHERNRTKEPKKTSAFVFSQENRLRGKPRNQLQQDRKDEWTLRSNEFEKTQEDKNPRKAYALL
ncbi:hypothetical protein RB195_023507 [Necator americanus]|uniref:Uncharacterized protein n=1 Tax=Necator americanus TaxID=51031 RepID=A0ABR1EK12_NECAM